MTKQSADYLSILSYSDFLGRSSSIAKQYHLTEMRASSINYALIGDDFAILFLLERDGVELCYIDSFSTHSKSYLLGHFLFKHRRTKEIVYPGNPGALPPAITIPIKLDFLLDLLAASPDILQGSRAWLREYDLEVDATPGIWLKELRAEKTT